MNKKLKIALIVVGGGVLLLYTRARLKNRPITYTYKFEKPDNYKEVIDNSVNPEQLTQSNRTTIITPASDDMNSTDNGTNSEESNYPTQIGNSSRNRPVAEDIITGLLNAEIDKDIDRVTSFFDNNMIRYWGYNYPTKQELKNIYFKAWTFVNDASYSNVNIQRVSEYTYDLYALYSYFDIRDHKEKSYSIRTRYEFNGVGKIISTYGVK